MRLTSAVASTFISLLLLACVGCVSDFGAAPPSTQSTSLGAIQGRVFGGQQPVTGASISVYAASNAGYGAASLLLSPVPATTDANGNFLLTGGYVCLAGQQVYVLATGGNSGAGSGVNSGIGLMAVLGTCPATGTFALALPYLSINEVSTIAAAYALAPFAVDATHVGGSGTTLGLQGLANAFANAGKFYDVTGAHGLGALATIPAGTAVAPQTLVHTLADILASCVNTANASSSTCLTLFGTATGDGTSSGIAPTETATAALNIAHHPGLNVPTLYRLVNSAPAFLPIVTYQPTDFALSLLYSKGYYTFSPGPVVIDAAGSAWTRYGVGQFASSGALLSQGLPYQALQVGIENSGNVWGFQEHLYESTPSGTAIQTLPIVYYHVGLAVDANDNAWVADSANGYHLNIYGHGGSTATTAVDIGSPAVLSFIAFDGNDNAWILATNGALKLSPSGGLSGSLYLKTMDTISGTGLDSSWTSYRNLALDSAGNVWVGDGQNSVLFKYSTLGTLLSPTGGFQPPTFTVDSSNTIATFGPGPMAIDGLGQVFSANVKRPGDRWDYSGGIVTYSNAGVITSGPYGYTAGGFINPADVNGHVGPQGAINFYSTPAIDGSGDVWVTGINGASGGLVEFVGLAAPVVTPVAGAVSAKMIGMRP